MKELHPVVWVGDSLKRLQEMPEQVKKSIGDELHLAQAGLMPPHGKPFKGVGSGVFEIRKNYDTDTYRAVYTVQIGENLYVLHTFQKKAKRGIKTSQHDVDLIKRRYKQAAQMEKETKT